MSSRWQWRLAQKRAHYELHFVKSLQFSFNPANNHPTAAEFLQRFTSNRARASNPDCEVTVDLKDDLSYRPVIKAVYENGMEEELDYEQRLDHLVKDFFERRERLRYFSELQFSLKNEEEENPFTSTGLAPGQGAKQEAKKPAGGGGGGGKAGGGPKGGKK